MSRKYEYGTQKRQGWNVVWPSPGWQGDSELLSGGPLLLSLGSLRLSEPMLISCPCLSLMLDVKNLGWFFRAFWVTILGTKRHGIAGFRQAKKPEPMLKTVCPRLSSLLWVSPCPPGPVHLWDPPFLTISPPWLWLPSPRVILWVVFWPLNMLFTCLVNVSTFFFFFWVWSQVTHPSWSLLVSSHSKGVCRCPFSRSEPLLNTGCVCWLIGEIT